ncbi:hypothetical protein MPLDJ20_330018 [Mesorhizobium plurifarium]|uniref:Uncharacterized protein n=1 Tax=Mesorhizobium plurifarium TaxID=69974 RepID=A0A090GNW9_MESPL|nr:hypothetical protein MPLDJ20_330018 [Mesorhizobium plurifarium]
MRQVSASLFILTFHIVPSGRRSLLWLSSCLTKCGRGPWVGESFYCFGLRGPYVERMQDGGNAGSVVTVVGNSGRECDESKSACRGGSPEGSGVPDGAGASLDPAHR